MKTAKWITLFSAVALISGCAASMSSSEGLYGSTPANIEDSDEKAMLSFDVVGHDMVDIRYAVKQAAGLDGLLVDVEKEHMLSGYGLSSGPQAMRCPNSRGYTFAAYFKAAEQSRTKVTILVDAIGLCIGDGDSAQFVAQKLMANTNKILLSYE